jgi:hypothetical protein
MTTRMEKRSLRSSNIRTLRIPSKENHRMQGSEMQKQNLSHLTAICVGIIYAGPLYLILK